MGSLRIGEEPFGGWSRPDPYQTSVTRYDHAIRPASTDLDDTKGVRRYIFRGTTHTFVKKPCGHAVILTGEKKSPSSQRE